MPWDSQEPAVRGTGGQLEKIAKEQCSRILNSKAAARFPREAEALVMIAFVYGAAWALGKQDLVDFSNAQIDALNQEHPS